MSCTSWWLDGHHKKKKCHTKPREKKFEVVPEVKYYRVGTTTDHVPLDVFRLKVTMTAPGGSGGWATTPFFIGSFGFATRGGGGGAGAFLQKVVRVTPGQSFTVVVGAGGAAPTVLNASIGTPGNPGTSNTTFSVGSTNLVAGFGQRRRRRKRYGKCRWCRRCSCWPCSTLSHHRTGRRSRWPSLRRVRR